MTAIIVNTIHQNSVDIQILVMEDVFVFLFKYKYPDKRAKRFTEQYNKV